MAKKTKELTLEEKLEQAIVPVEEQPYEVPENWCWTYLGQVADWGSGGTPSRKHPEYYGGSIPWIKTGELNDGYIYDSEEKITEEAIQHSSAKIFPKDTVAIAMYGATIGKVGIFGIDATTNQACACAKCKVPIDKKYLFHYARSQKDAFIEKGKGGAQPNISQDIIKKHPVPLPPLAEQQRIVDRIESLFAKLDEAKDKLQSVLDDAENHKANILYSAFEGQLSANWRKQNSSVADSEIYLSELNEKRDKKSKFVIEKRDDLPSTWSVTKLDKFIYFAGRIGWKGLKADEYTEEGPLFLSVYNLNYGDYVDYRDAHHISAERYDESPEIMLREDDILLTKDGAGIGKLGYVKNLPDRATVNSSLLVIRAGESVNSKYLYYYLLGPKLQRLAKERITGSATPHLFQKDIKEFALPVPPIEEQLYLADILERLLEREDIIFENAKKSMDEIEVIKKSILAKAFRGELGTNISDENSSIELLKSVIEEG